MVAFAIDELWKADEISVISSVNFCLAARNLKGKTIGGKAKETVALIQRILMKEFHDYCGTT